MNTKEEYTYPPGDERLPETTSREDGVPSSVPEGNPEDEVPSIQGVVSSAPEGSAADTGTHSDVGLGPEGTGLRAIEPEQAQQAEATPIKSSQSRHAFREIVE